MTSNHSSPAFAPASTPTLAPRPTLAVFDSLSLCRNCGEDYYPEDIPAALADVGQYHTCGDCREQAATEMAAWAVGAWS